MPGNDCGNGRQPHDFGHHHIKPGESRTAVVMAITAVTMVIEVAAGLLFGSMALLADGLHMASHAVALGIATLAYRYARRHAYDPTFSFGTGKVNSLAGFAGAMLLSVFAFLMIWESIHRFLFPTPIVFNWALLVAVVGLAINGISVWILGNGEAAHASSPTVGEDTEHSSSAPHDHNLRSAYLHVLADALTSLLAIAALLAGKYGGLRWMDPLIGMLGALLVARWSAGLLRETAHILLDRQAPQKLVSGLRDALESEAGVTIEDFHCWPIGPSQYAAVISISVNRPQSPSYYRNLLPRDQRLVHVTIEVHDSASAPAAHRS